MLQGLAAKVIINQVIKALEKVSDMRIAIEHEKRIMGLEIQMKQAHKNIAKQGKTIEELEKDNAILKKNSHEPRDFVCCNCCENKIKEK